jgi:hypothetical protein
MKWTSEVPQEEGWYWLRVDGKHVGVTRVRPIMENETGLYAAIRTRRLVPVNFNHDREMEGTEWAGPIPEPTEE